MNTAEIDHFIEGLASAGQASSVSRFADWTADNVKVTCPTPRS
jgi:hypothetical protein